LEKGGEDPGKVWWAKGKNGIESQVDFERPGKELNVKNWKKKKKNLIGRRNDWSRRKYIEKNNKGGYIEREKKAHLEVTMIFPPNKVKRGAAGKCGEVRETFRERHLT